jgi:hypothetical protein
MPLITSKVILTVAYSYFLRLYCDLASFLLCWQRKEKEGGTFED